MAEKTRDVTGAHPVTDDEVRAVVQGAARRSRGVSVPVAALWVCLAAALVAVAAIAVAGFAGAGSAAVDGAAAGDAAASGATAPAGTQGAEVTVSLSLPSGWPAGRAPAVPVALTGMTVDGEEVADVLAPAPDHPRAATLAPGVYELALANGTVEVDGRVFGTETVRFSVDGSGGARDVTLVLREEDGGEAAAVDDAAAGRGDADVAAGDAAGGASEGRDDTAAGDAAVGTGGDAGWGVSSGDVGDLLDAIDRTKELVDAVSQW